MSDVGEAFIDIRADETKLSADLLNIQAKVLSELRKIEKNAKIEMKASSTEVERAIARVQTQLSKLKLEEIRLTANTAEPDEKIARLQVALRELAKVRPEITAKVEDTIAKGKIADLIALGKELGAQRPSLKVVLDGEAALAAKLEAIKVSAGALDSKRINIHVGVDGEAVAVGKLEALKLASRDINQFSENVSKRGLIGALGVTGLIGGLAAAGAVISGFGVKTVASLEQVRIGFQGVLGPKGGADEFISQIRDFAAVTPFEFDQVTESAQRLIGTFGKGFKNDVIPTLETVGDVAATLGQGADSIDRVVSALARIQGKGKVTARELNSISEALPGFQSRAAIAAGVFGVGVGQVTPEQLQQAGALTTAGAVGAADGIRFLLDAMKEFPGAADAMERQSATLNGRLSTLKDNVKILATEAFKPLADVVKGATNALVGAVTGGEIQSAAKALGVDSATAISGIVDGVINSIGPGGEAIGNTLISIGNAVESLLPKVAKALVPVTEILEKLTEVGTDGLDTLLDVALPALEAASTIIGAIPVGILDTLLASFLAFKAVGVINGIIEATAAKILAASAAEELAIGQNAVYAASFEAIDVSMAQAVAASEAVNAEFARLTAQSAALIDAEIGVAGSTTVFAGTIAELDVELALLGGQLAGTDAALTTTGGTAVATSTGIATIVPASEAAAASVTILGTALSILGTGLLLAPIIFAVGTIASFAEDLSDDADLIKPAFDAAADSLRDTTLALSENNAELQKAADSASGAALAYKTVAESLASIVFPKPEAFEGVGGVISSLNPFSAEALSGLQSSGKTSVSDALLNLEVGKDQLFNILDEIRKGGADRITDLQSLIKNAGGINLSNLGFNPTGSLKEGTEITDTTRRITDSIATLADLAFVGGQQINDVLRPALQGIKVDGDDAAKAALNLAEIQLGLTEKQGGLGLQTEDLLDLYVQYTENLVNTKTATDELGGSTENLADKLANDVDVDAFSKDLDKIKDSSQLATDALNNLKDILDKLSGTPISLAQQASEIQTLFDALHTQEQATDPVTGKKLEDADGNPIFTTKNRINKAFTTDQFAAAGPLSSPQTQENLAALIQFGQAFQQQAIDKVTKGGVDAATALDEYALALSFLRNEFGDAGISADDFNAKVTELGLDPIVVQVALDQGSKQAVLDQIAALGEDTPPEIIAALTAEANTGSVALAAAELQALADLTPAELAVFVSDTSQFGVTATLQALANPESGYIANIDARLAADAAGHVQTDLNAQAFNAVVHASINEAELQAIFHSRSISVQVVAHKTFFEESGDHLTRFMKDGGSTLAGALAQQVPHRTNIQRVVYGEPSTHGEYLLSMAPGYRGRNEELLVAAAKEMGSSKRIAERLMGTPSGGGTTVVDLEPMRREIASLRKALLAMPPITVVAPSDSPEALGSAVYWANRDRGPFG